MQTNNKQYVSKTKCSAIIVWIFFFSLDFSKPPAPQAQSYLACFSVFLSKGEPPPWLAINKTNDNLFSEHKQACNGQQVVFSTGHQVGSC